MPPSDSSPKLGHPDVAGWVLGALDPNDAEHFAEHLLSCEACQAAVIELEPVARALRNPTAEPDTAAMQPPADLAARTLTRVEWEARLAGAETTPTGPEIQAGTSTSASEARPDVPQPAPADQATKPADAETQSSGHVVKVAAWRRASVRAISLGAAAAVAIGAGIAIWASQPSPTALAFSIPLHASHGGTATGQAYARHAQNGWSIQLTVHGLKNLGQGRFYECWYTSPRNRPGHPDLIATGTFTVGSSGSATVQMWSAADPRTFPTMQITAEQAGDAGQHGTVILSGSI